MAKRSNLDVAFFLVSGRNLLGYATDLTDEVEALTDDAKVLTDAWPKPTPTGDFQAAFTQNGFYDDASHATNAVLSQTSTSRVITYGFNDNVIGRAFSGFEGAFTSKFRRITEKNKLHRCNADYTISGKHDEGVILHALGEETADGNSEASSVDNGEATADGGAAYLEVTDIDLDGHTALSVIGRHSEDDETFVNLVTMTAVTTAPGGERKTFSGAVYQYLACAWDFTGAGTSPAATFMFGVARG